MLSLFQCDSSKGVIGRGSDNLIPLLKKRWKTLVQLWESWQTSFEFKFKVKTLGCRPNWT